MHLRDDQPHALKSTVSAVNATGGSSAWRAIDASAALHAAGS